MVEIPEHLLKRSQAARQRAGGDGDGEAAPPATDDASSDTTSEGAEAPAASASAAPAAAPAAAAPAGGGRAAAAAVAARPAAVPVRTQRLLTVVKAGSIQQVKAEPGDKVNVWPHLLQVEFVALLLCSAFLIVFSIFKQSPLQSEANFNFTPNPSKAPWYFLGLQELLSYFDAQVAGVYIPGFGLAGLMAIPFIDRNLSHHPEDRKIAIAIFSMFIVASAVLTIFGSFFRGEGFNFVFPWEKGLFFDF